MGASTRPIKLDKWGISWEEYRELVYFCLQYQQKKRRAEALLTIPSTTATPATYHVGGQEYGAFLPHGGGIGDPVAATAARREKYLRDVGLIESAARAACREAGEGVYPVLLRAVTTRDGVRKVLASAHPPIGERQFYALRRKFFWLLREMRSGSD